MNRVYLNVILGLILLNCFVASQKWDELTWTTTQPNARSYASVASFRVDKKVVLSAIFGGVNDDISTLYNDVWGFTLDFNNPENTQWALLHDGTGGNVPVPRYGHQTTVIETDSDASTLTFLLFGGYGGSTYGTAGPLEDTWIFTVDETTSSWAQLTPTQSPPTRYFYAMVPLILNSVTGGNKRYSGAGLMGGTNGSYPLNDFWVFTTETNEWLYVDLGEFEPRWGHSAVVYNGDVYIFGGQNGTQFFDDVWHFSLTDGTWKRVYNGGSTGPSARIMHSAASASGGFIVFGGVLSNGTASNDLWLFDVGSSKWTDLTQDSLKASNETVPSARYGAAAQGIAELGVSGRNSDLVVFAGEDGVSVFNDVWYLSIPKDKNGDDREVIGPSITGAFMILAFVGIPVGMSVFYHKQ